MEERIKLLEDKIGTLVGDSVAVQELKYRLVIEQQILVIKNDLNNLRSQVERDSRFSLDVRGIIANLEEDVSSLASELSSVTSTTGTHEKLLQETLVKPLNTLRKYLINGLFVAIILAALSFLGLSVDGASSKLLKPLIKSEE